MYRTYFYVFIKNPLSCLVYVNIKFLSYKITHVNISLLLVFIFKLIWEIREFTLDKINGVIL